MLGGACALDMTGLVSCSWRGLRPGDDEACVLFLAGPASGNGSGYAW